MRELLLTIQYSCEHDSRSLLQRSEWILTKLQEGSAEQELTHIAIELYSCLCDRKYGGFGQVPKFLSTHNLLFLLSNYERYNSAEYGNDAERQLDFMAPDAPAYPCGYGMFLTALLEHNEPPVKVTAVTDGKSVKGDLITCLPPTCYINDINLSL